MHRHLLPYLPNPGVGVDSPSVSVQTPTFGLGGLGRLKRFTETTKWVDPWFMDLPCKYKSFWIYICDQCDCAGIWEPNIRLAVAQIGEPLELTELLRIFAGRLEQLPDGKLWVTKFIEFQYGILSPDCKPHVPVLKRLSSLGLKDRVLIPFPKGTDTLQEKEKEKDKVKKKGECEGEEVLMIYSLYPRKVARPEALRAIKNALTKIPFILLSQKVSEYSKVRASQNPALTPYPASWFNKERFNDDPETWKDFEHSGNAPRKRPDVNQERLDREYEEARKTYG